MSRSSSSVFAPWALVLVLLLGAFATWMVVVPRVAIARMVLAIEARDHEALSRSIDFPRLRESLRAEVSASLRARAGDSRRAAAGAAVGDIMVGSVIDLIVTPEGLPELMRGGNALARLIPDGALPASSTSEPPDFRIRSQGLHEVHVIMDSPSGEFRLLFERGLTTVQLVGVRLPR